MIKDVDINILATFLSEDEIPSRLAHGLREHRHFGEAVVPWRSPLRVVGDSVLYHSLLELARGKTFRVELCTSGRLERSRWRGRRCACRRADCCANLESACTEEANRVRISGRDAHHQRFEPGPFWFKVLWVPKWHSNPIADRIRRKRQRLPSSLLIENASVADFLHLISARTPRRFRSRLATIRTKGLCPYKGMLPAPDAQETLAGRFIIFASLGQRGLARKGLRNPAEAFSAAKGSRRSINSSYQSIAASISERIR